MPAGRVGRCCVPMDRAGGRTGRRAPAGGHSGDWRGDNTLLRAPAEPKQQIAARRAAALCRRDRR
eukprot:scaffold14562_cov133-Isochrysis_galbana.AAC.5